MAIGLCILPSTPSRKNSSKRPQVGKPSWHNDDDDDPVNPSAKSHPVSPPNPSLELQRGILLRSLSINFPLVSPAKPLRLAYLGKSPPVKPAQAKPCPPAKPAQAKPVAAMAPGAAPPPPPPPEASKKLCAKKAIGKLKRSVRMVKWYQTLKRKVEGQVQQVKNAVGKKTRVQGTSGEKQGLDDAIAEMMKRSAYFQLIEEDVSKHHQEIIQLRAAIDSFQTKDIQKLLQFHKAVEEQLEKLTDETKVLTRFEDFPVKKLESLREAAALYSKLKEIIDTLQNWKIEPPLGEFLDTVESFFNKIKVEIEVVERNKDELAKKFQSNNISFDFNILVRVKESMVDISSSCMELALKERREASEGKMQGSVKLLWRAFQLAFRIYSFAGGQDDRADRLTEELAQEIADAQT
ncbi:PREDICTED: uncharacterized protein At4g04980-like [Ipomoea nil]|uniref:uncharacterized protein At4g04980-like n=1 Tax=Ipomoea nil TaxID=35883 RepID=UPI000900A1A4|nr:PREDICTED: uncharacterized protein At4g04980-like [Ipomoea nil]